MSILHSSGTTGRPKPVIQTHQSSIAGPRFRMANDVVAPGERVLTALPQSHIGAISFSSYALLCGTPMIALYDPTSAQLLEAIREHRPTAVMGFSHIHTELAAFDVAPGDLDSVERWISVGDAVHEPHIRTLLEHRSRRPRAVDVPRPPGLDGARLGAAAAHDHARLADPRAAASARPTGAGEVVVLRKDGTRGRARRARAARREGPDDHAGVLERLRPELPQPARRVLAVGRRGLAATRTGVFYQVDRAVDVIETASGPGYSVLMEEVLLGNVAEICDCGVVAGRRGDETVAVALVRTTPGAGDVDRVLEAANDALRAAGHPELALIEVARTDADYPVGVTGKVLKRVLRDRYCDLEAYLADRGDRILASTS